MTRKFPHVSSPITIGRTTFRNRIFSAPMGGTDITNDWAVRILPTTAVSVRNRRPFTNCAPKAVPQPSPFPN